MSVSREEFDLLKSEVSQLKKTSAPKKPRNPSEYNIFVGKKCQELKAKNADMKQSEIFELAVKAWNQQKEMISVSDQTTDEKTEEKTEEPKKDVKKSKAPKKA